MNIMGILQGAGRLVGSFFGMGSAAPAEGGKAPVQVIADTIDEYKYTSEEAAHDEMARFSTDAEATTKTVTADSRSGTSPFDAMVDAINRLQRPAWGLYFFGGFIGLYEFPDLTRLAAATFWVTLFTIYFTALFGGRAVFKDLAQAIVKIIDAKK